MLGDRLTVGVWGTKKEDYEAVLQQLRDDLPGADVTFYPKSKDPELAKNSGPNIRIVFITNEEDRVRVECALRYGKTRPGALFIAAVKGHPLDPETIQELQEYGLNELTNVVLVDGAPSIKHIQPALASLMEGIEKQPIVDTSKVIDYHIAAESRSYCGYSKD